jgi:sugar transferase (PEP-CTERM/EpsH1 system associated)
MRIAMLAPRLPWPLDSGASIRNYHLLAALARHHSLSLLAFAPRPESADRGPVAELCATIVLSPLPAPRPISRRALDLLVNPRPDLAERMWSADFQAKFMRLLRDVRPDAVQVEGLEMARYPLELGAPGSMAYRLVYDAHNVEYVLQARAAHMAARSLAVRPAIYSAIQAFKLRRFEIRLWCAAAHTLTVSAADAGAVRELAPEAAVTVVPNGVDVDSYQPTQPGSQDPSLVLFVGRMDFRPNVEAVEWFCRSVWPAVRQTHAGARFAIVGASPGRQVRALSGPDVDVTGYVADVRPWLARAGVVVVPVRSGSGTRLKVLEAMAAGKAIVSTALGVEGIAVEPGLHALVTDTAAGFGAAVSEVLADPARGRALGDSARRLAIERYGWSSVLAPLPGVYAA